MHGIMALNADWNLLHNLETNYHKALETREGGSQEKFLFKIPKNCTKIELKDSAIHKTSHLSYRDLQVK